MDQVETPPPSIRTFVPQASPAVEHAFHRALAKDPALRFGSAIETGEVFRTAFDIPSTPERRALGEFAHVAKASAAEEPDKAQKLATLTQVVVQASARNRSRARPPHPSR